MRRSPIPETNATPPCYSFSFSAEKTLCKGCAHRTECSTLTTRWLGIRSLAEHVELLQRRLTVAPVSKTSGTGLVEEVYKSCYEQFFGKRPFLRRGSRFESIFSRLTTLFVREEIDPIVYISASMSQMKLWLNDPARNPRGLSFMPSMLSGPNAMRRYNSYLQHGQSHYRRGTSDVTLRETSIGELRNELYQGELEVGRLYILSNLGGESMTWESAAVNAETPPMWVAAFRPGTREYRELSSRFEPGRLESECQLARLRAACAVAAEIRHDYPERIAFVEFSWGSLLTLLRTVWVRQKPKSEVLLAPRHGRQYGVEQAHVSF